MQPEPQRDEVISVAKKIVSCRQLFNSLPGQARRTVRRQAPGAVFPPEHESGGGFGAGRASSLPPEVAAAAVTDTVSAL